MLQPNAPPELPSDLDVNPNPVNTPALPDNTSLRAISLSTIAIRRHIATLVLTVAVIVLGLFFIQQLPVDLLPSITYPRVGVRADAPGVSPETVSYTHLTLPTTSRV